jgi:hypothetical protein
MSNNYRRLKSGYSDLGPIIIPPNPQAVVLTDRGTGLKWMISYNVGPPIRLSIVDQYSSIQRQEGVKVFDADSGPVIDLEGEFILMVRDGHIGFDYNPNPVHLKDRDDPPVYARLGYSEYLMFLTTPEDVLTSTLGLIV